MTRQRTLPEGHALPPQGGRFDSDAALTALEKANPRIPDGMTRHEYKHWLLRLTRDLGKAGYGLVGWAKVAKVK